MQLSRSTGQIIAFDKGVPLVNALVLGYLSEYRHKSYIAKNRLLDYIVGLYPTS